MVRAFTTEQTSLGSSDSSPFDFPEPDFSSIPNCQTPKLWSAVHHPSSHHLVCRIDCRTANILFAPLCSCSVVESVYATNPNSKSKKCHAGDPHLVRSNDRQVGGRTMIARPSCIEMQGTELCVESAPATKQNRWRAMEAGPLDGSPLTRSPDILQVAFSLSYPFFQGHQRWSKLTLSSLVWRCFITFC